MSIRGNKTNAWARPRCSTTQSRVWGALFALGVSISALAGTQSELALVPGSVELTYQGAIHELLVVSLAAGEVTGDVTSKAAFTSSHPEIARVDERGNVHAMGDGVATITARIDGHELLASVRVSGAGAPFVPSFQNHIQPLLFKMGCNTGACHGAAAGKNGFRLSLRGFDDASDHSALTRHANGRRVSLADPAQSLVLLKPTMAIPHEGGERFTEDSESYARMLAWLQAGAPMASEADPQVARLELMPKRATLAPGNAQRILVRAHYTDGTYEDVSRWAKFGTTEDTVAEVAEDGTVTVLTPGAAAITVYYQSKVATAQITAPRETPVDPSVYAAAPRNNYIDELILQQLERLRIAPAGEASDEEFVRRAYLDTIGMLPTPGETMRFLFDAAPGKHARLMEELLARPEYVDYWAYKWSDVLLLSSRNLPRREELNSFYRFIRDSVEANKSWDQFAREILTATGSTTENGAAAYFAMHKEPIDLTETTSQAFLGMSITCARCHNHPLEKWTQNDYYGMANLFGRVKRKNSLDGPGTDVLPAASGDVVHPRLGEPLPPRPLEGAALALDAPDDRRVRLAEWVTSPENPYFTRAIVNRVWRNFMGRGLVEPEDDLRLTNPPTNGDLLDALAADLIEHNYDLKHLIRQITSSAAYNRASLPADPAAPDDRFYSHYIVRRLSAEVILDAYSSATGVPTDFPGYPSGFRALQLPDSQVGSYFLTAFGRPPRIQTCSCERTEDSSVAQTLHVANGETLNGKLRADNSNMAALAAGKRPVAEIVDELYLRTLARFPSADEKTRAIEIMDAIDGDSEEAVVLRREAIEDLAWALLTSKEFLFNH